MRADAPRARRINAPDYDDASYWDTKFATGQDVGEWLNPGDVLLDALVSFLETRSPHEHATPRVLHLGPGISKLGTKVRDALVARGWPGNGIVNADFSAEAVRLGRGIESKQEPSQAMRWAQVDLRSWTDVSQLLPFAPFDAVMDKSTSDAIATGSLVTLAKSEDSLATCPTIQDTVKSHGEIMISPVELLGLHLVPLTRKGSRWFVLSYSTMRFENVPHIAAYWKCIARQPVEAPGGQTVSGAYTPAVYHWLHVLERI
ncbi:hypothetical protein BDV18DRAFT_142343 [Aspergillus unguis]